MTRIQKSSRRSNCLITRRQCTINTVTPASLTSIPRISPEVCPGHVSIPPLIKNDARSLHSLKNLQNKREWVSRGRAAKMLCPLVKRAIAGVLAPGFLRHLLTLSVSLAYGYLLYKFQNPSQPILLQPSCAQAFAVCSDIAAIFRRNEWHKKYQSAAVLEDK